MDLTTRCPNCGSTFSVSLEQLQLRKGFIRCTNCAHIFDGYEAVVPGGPEPSAAPTVPSVVRQRSKRQPPKPQAPAPFTVRPRQPVAQFVPEPVPPESTPPEPAPFVISSTQTARAAQRTEPVMSSVYSPQSKHKEQATEPRLESEPIYAKTNDDAEASGIIYADPRRGGAIAETEFLPDFLDDQRERSRGFVHFFWSILIIAGLVLLLGQAAYVYRAQIASEAPFLRPILEKACVSLHCKVSYRRRIQLISIMNSSLRSNAKTADPRKHPDQMTLQVTLRNNDEGAQEWPVLILDLVDFSGTVVAKKNLAPDVYLSPDALRKPFAGKSEIVATVPITLNGIKINGFQLGKFFP
jgi:predicted Zn finger-like uncharacterized protein